MGVSVYDRTMIGSLLLAFAWYLGAFLIPFDWKPWWLIAPVWLALTFLALVSVAAWVAKKLRI